MMMFAIFDRALNGFMPPFSAQSKGLALRMFGDALKQGDTPMAAHPKDFDLYHIGGFDEDTGELVPAARSQIARGEDEAPLPPVDREGGAPGR